MENDKDIQALFRRYLANSYTAYDLSTLLRYFGDKANEYNLRELILQALASDDSTLNHTVDDIAASRIIERSDALIMQHVNDDSRNTRPLYRRWFLQIAAAATVLISIGSYYWFNVNKLGTPQSNNVSITDANPASGTAVLTLSDGRKISLDNNGDGEVASDGGTHIRQTEGDKLVYEQSSNNNSKAITYNTLTTPKGGTYRLTLADGSKVWLNAGSELRFPAQFAGNSRTVTIKGEAYFEVAKDLGKPFVVESAGQQITVLGTHFNVKAYAEEPTAITTLLEGSIRLEHLKNHSTQTLKPGQEASAGEKTLTVRQVDTENAIAWKDGIFRFQNTDMKAMMQEIGRWYNVEVDLAGLPDKEFTGQMSRQIKLSQLIVMIKTTSGVQLKLEEGRLFMEK